MEALMNRVKALLEQGEVKAVVGYTKGTGNVRRPCFVRECRQAERLLVDEACTQNLATYATKDEVRRLGKLAIIALPSTQRALLQLMAERQLRDGEIVVLAVDGGKLEELSSAQALEEHLALDAGGLDPKDKALLERLGAMSREERWVFWQKEFSRCMKCYACRNSCPMCYCANCTMDCNRPQWVPVASHSLGNLEYHMVRTMHLAGRCVECGECGRACPVGIPVHLLTLCAEEVVHEQFGQQAGHKAKLDYALSTFRTDDKESFIR
jgi:formate dehydrogenase (coenzyme F420) beta subunit